MTLAQGRHKRQSVAIIGSGFGGLAIAIELKRAGYEDLVLFEKAHDVGGVWRENTYPGAACDVPSPFYSFSFEPNPRWPRRFSPQPAILDYLRFVADKYDVRRHIRFGTEVTAAHYDDAAGVWQIHTDGGESLTVDVLVPAVGQLSRPSLPVLEGRERFTGPSFHSAQWDHGVCLEGKRVAVIGTGASAVQFVPEIQPLVDRLTLFQRSAPYLLPRPDRAFSSLHHKVFERLPLTQLVERGFWFGVVETLGVAFLYSRLLSTALTLISRLHLRRQVDQRALREKLWPDYPVGCKRILFSSDYFPALDQPNVEVVTDRIEEITESGVRTEGGVLHDVDVLIYGTGFKATEFLAPIRVTGARGIALNERWASGAHAYLGIAVPDFPSLYLMYGPNTNVGGGSIVFMLESQATYIRQAIEAQEREAAPLVVRADVEASFDAEVQGRLAGGVWTKCDSWYRDPDGRISTNWPLLTVEYRRRTAIFDRSCFEVARS